MMGQGHEPDEEQISPRPELLLGPPPAGTDEHGPHAVGPNRLCRAPATDGAPVWVAALFTLDDL